MLRHGVALIGGHLGTIFEWRVPPQYDARPGVVESQVLTATNGQLTLFPLPGRNHYARN